MTKLLIAAAILAATSSAWSQDADAALTSFFKRYLEQSFRQRPSEATRLGEHRFDAQLEDVSPAARKRWLAQDKATLKELPRAFRDSRLSPDGQIDYQILKQELVRNIWLTENIHPFEEDPRTYGGYISDSVYSLLTQSTLPRETNIANCIARMTHIPGLIATAKRTLTRPPKPLLETAILQNRGALAFYEGGLFQLAGDSPQRAKLRAAAAPVLVALRDYQQFLETDLMARADGDWRLGKKKFAKKLELVLDSGMTADQVLADAQAEFHRVTTELYVVARQLWSKYYPDQPLPPDDHEGRRLTIQMVTTAVGREHGKPEDLLADTRSTVDAIKSFIKARNILRLPEPDRCQVLEMPEFRRGNSVAYMENAAPLDPEGLSIFAVSPPPSDWPAARVTSFLEEYNRHMLQILTIHEAYPGHYVQIVYANRNPSLIRRILASGVYVEGWAVYTEQTMLDQGYGGGDLALRLMQLKFYLRAVVNAILDHKMHCTAMTDEQALNLLVDDAFQSEGEARLKIIRAKQSSTQLSTYFVGRMAMYRLRQAVQRELGDKFPMAQFHQTLLQQGSVPVKYLPDLFGRPGATPNRKGNATPNSRN